MSRLVPAPISEELTKKIQEAAKRAFRAVDASGIARVDFMVNPALQLTPLLSLRAGLKGGVKPESEEFWITEINTLPGSLSFYIWEKSGISFSNLLDKLIDLGFERHKERQLLMTSYDSDLISKTSGSSKV